MFPESFKIVGFLSKSHGVKGTMVLRMERNFEDDLTEREFLFISVDGTMIPFFLENIKMAGDDAFVKFREIDSEKDALVIKGKNVFIPAEEEDSVDLHSLTGFNFMDETSGASGIIVDYHEQGENPLFSVAIKEKEFLVPVHQEFIISFDVENKQIIMRLPEGIFDLED